MSCIYDGASTASHATREFTGGECDGIQLRPSPRPDERRTPLSDGRADREPLGGTAPRVADVLLEVADVAPKSSQSGPASRLARSAQHEHELLQ